MKSDFKALLFDLDGTLADTIPAIAEAINMTLANLGYPSRTEDEIRNFIGRGPKHLITKSLGLNTQNSNDELVSEALKLYDKMYAETYMHTDKLYDGIYDALVALSKKYKIAVLSNKQDEYVKALVNQLLPDGICLIARGSLAGVPAKPEPTAALSLISDLGVKPNECILIGDSEIDIMTAKNAGIGILSVSWGYSEKARLLSFGDIDIIDSPNDLIEYFK